MLVLTLRVNEAIEIAGARIMVTGISIRGLKLKGGAARVGITAPKNMKVRRTGRIGTKPQGRRAGR